MKFQKIISFIAMDNQNKWVHKIHCCSVTQSCPTLCNAMDCSTPGFPVLYHLPELARARVHWVRDAIQPSHLLSSSSSPALNLSQYQSLFQLRKDCQLLASGGQNIGASASASLLPVNIQSWFPLISTESAMPSNHLISCCPPLLLP